MKSNSILNNLFLAETGPNVRLTLRMELSRKLVPSGKIWLLERGCLRGVFVTRKHESVHETGADFV